MSPTQKNRRLHYYSKIGLLVIDEPGFLAFDDRNADLLLQVFSRRYEKSLVLTTNSRLRRVAYRLAQRHLRDVCRSPHRRRRSRREKREFPSIFRTHAVVARRRNRCALARAQEQLVSRSFGERRIERWGFGWNACC